MNKTALLLHGYPRIDSESLLFRYFKKNKYEIICPYLFANNYQFTLPEITRYIQEALSGNYPNVIVGVSLGGLILPSFALRYPRAKLIFVASGASVNPKSVAFKSLLNNFADTRLLKVITKLPYPILSFFYSVFNPFYGDKISRENYEKDKVLNLNAIRHISSVKHQEIIKFIVSTDNSSILPELKQKILILSSDRDPLMPLAEGKNIQKLFKDSKLVKTNGGHFEAVNEKTIIEIAKFLEIKN